MIRTLFETTLTRLFVDANWPHRFWRCHNMPTRSFSIQGRQFHLCARCTGLVVGGACSWMLLPMRHLMPLPAAISLLVLSFDGLTQLVGWRSSNNLVRFMTGAGLGLMGPSGAIAFVGW